MERFCDLRKMSYSGPRRRLFRPNHRRVIGGCVAVSALLACAAAAQENATIAPSSMPSSMTVLGDKIFSAADDGIHGAELWITDGEPGGARLLKDIWPGVRGSEPSQFHVFGNRLLFAANSPENEAAISESGSELWITDGTLEGTRLVKDINSGGGASDIKWMVNAGGVAYFQADGGGSGAELWRTDGTRAGTVMVKDINPGTIGSDCAKGSAETLPNGQIIFVAYYEGMIGLFVSDGTGAGTQLLMTVNDGTHIETALGGRVLFVTAPEEFGSELWETDGTLPGTRLVKDIYPGPIGSNPGRLTLVDGVCWFAARDPDHGEELWRTDGTSEGTQLVNDLVPDLSDSKPYSLTPADGYVFFVAVAPQLGRELWRTDGTPEGTILLKDIYPGPAESEPYALCAAGDRLFFTAKDPENGEELWLSDGTPEGTRLVKDINPESHQGTPLSSFPDKTVAIGDKVFFRATTEREGCELWRSDGTEAGTILLDDIWYSFVANPSSSPHELTAMNNELYFVASDIEHGNELFRTKGAGSSAELVLDIFPGIASSDPHDLTPVGNVLYFGADDGTNGDELWRSDGTPGGTALVQDFALGRAHAHPHEIVAFGRGICFVAWSEQTGSELCFSDGKGISVVHDIAAGPASSNPRELVVIGSHLYFAANDGVHGDELWVTDGTFPNTRMVYDLLPKASFGSIPSNLAPVEQVLFFSANNGATGTELWSVQPIGEIPRLVADVARPRALIRSVAGGKSKEYDRK